MANISWLGNDYTDVPYIELPQTGGGNATFTDVTDTTATASDVAQGSYFYTASGVRTLGTATGGGVDGDNLAYGLSLVGSAIVGSSVVS